MSGPSAGRNLDIYKSADSPANLVAACISKSISISATPIDVTTDDDDGYQKLLANVAGKKSISLSLEGVAKNANFISQITSGNLTDTFVLDIDGIGEITGTFNLTNVDIQGEVEDAIKFTAQLQSSGAWTFAADS